MATKLYQDLNVGHLSRNNQVLWDKISAAQMAGLLTTRTFRTDKLQPEQVASLSGFSIELINILFFATQKWYIFNAFSLFIWQTY